MSPEETKRETEHDNIALEDRPLVDRILKHIFPTLTVIRRILLLQTIALTVAITLVIVLDNNNDATIDRVDTNSRTGAQAICTIADYAQVQSAMFRERLDSGEVPDTKQARDSLEALEQLYDDMIATGVNCSPQRQAERREEGREDAGPTPTPTATPEAPSEPSEP